MGDRMGANRDRAHAGRAFIMLIKVCSQYYLKFVAGQTRTGDNLSGSGEKRRLHSLSADGHFQASPIRRFQSSRFFMRRY